MLSRIYSSRWGRVALAGAAGAGMLLSAAAPAAQAATLTQAQIDSITSLLTSFNVSSTTIANIRSVLSGGAITGPGSTPGAAGSVRGFMIGYLKRGDHGKPVCYLHAVLAADPNVSVAILASDADGDCPFGALTENALKRFQSKHGIPAVGFIGPRTLKAIDDELSTNQLGTEDDGTTTGSTTPSGGGHGYGRVCAIVPPGHLIAPGWLRKHDGVRPAVPECQKLPPGIANRVSSGSGTTTPPVADTTAPVISGISAGSIASTSATILWTTDESASSKVYYSTTSPVNLSTAMTESSSSLVTAHSLGLTGLVASTTYSYVVESSDAASNVATSSTHSFLTD